MIETALPSVKIMNIKKFQHLSCPEQSRSSRKVHDIFDSSVGGNSEAEATATYTIAKSVINSILWADSLGQQ